LQVDILITTRDGCWVLADVCCYSWSNMPKCAVIVICCLGENRIVCWACIRRWVHFFCHKNVVNVFIHVLIYFLTTCAHATIAHHQWSSWVPSCDAYFLLLKTCVHSPVMFRVFQPSNFVVCRRHTWKNIPRVFHTSQLVYLHH